MKKPTQAITSHADWDYELLEHVARGLEHSALHVAGALTFVAVPEEIGGDPNHELSSVGLNLALVTDFKRGWLALVRADEECDWGQVAGELVDDLMADVGAVSPAPHVALGANSYKSEDLVAGALDLRTHRRRQIEEAFEAHFADCPPLGPDAFEWMHTAMAACNLGWLTEADLRETMNESPELGLKSVPREESGVHVLGVPVLVGPVLDKPNRQERRKQKALTRRKKNERTRRA